MIVANLSELSPLWENRVVAVDAALARLVEEHGAPNSFYTADVAARIPNAFGIKPEAIRRVGLYMHRFIRVEFGGKGFNVSYARGRFTLTEAL